MTEDQLVEVMKRTMDDRHPPFRWSQLIPHTKYGKSLMFVCVMLAMGTKASDVVMIGRGMLGLPTAIVATPAPVAEVKKALKDHCTESSYQFDRIEGSLYDHEKENRLEMKGIRDIMDVHTSQLDTIISMSNRVNP